MWENSSQYTCRSAVTTVTLYWFQCDMTEVCVLLSAVYFMYGLPLHTTTTTVLRPFFWDHPGELVPEENFWTLWCKGRLTEADTLTILMGATPSGLTSAHLHHPPIFYRPDALPAAQLTMSKHWRQEALKAVWTTTVWNKWTDWLFD